ncbi:DUF6502 family protein [Acidocella sp.]|uniref:DUF6502 family protein n=1 Tax=Acidocella sp. TaxID=50710 RepID=UPI003CFD7120
MKRLLRPLVRLSILSGITFPVLSDILRGLFVDVALHDVLEPDARTDSRVSLLTGVYRKEIKRLRQETGANLAEPPIVTIGSQIVAHWVGSPAYTDKTGRPMALPRLRPPGGGPSFETLIESVTTDIRPRAVLDEFLAQGIVAMNADETVSLMRNAFIPSQGQAEQLFYFARNLHDHAAAAVTNVIARSGPVFVDSSVHYDQLSPDAAARLASLARDQAEQALLSVNRAAQKLTDVQTGAQPATRRVNFGIYIYSCDEHPPEDKP